MNAICQRALSTDSKGSKGTEEDMASKNQGDGARKKPGLSHLEFSPGKTF